MSKLLTDMTRLVNRAKDVLKEKWDSRGTADIHCETCHCLADEFRLWDEEDGFPIWLSRIVQGELNDLEFEMGDY